MDESGEGSNPALKRLIVETATTFTPNVWCGYWFESLKVVTSWTRLIPTHSGVSHQDMIHDVLIIDLQRLLDKTQIYIVCDLKLVYNHIRCGLTARISRFHRGGRGSIPRTGTPSFIFVLLITSCVSKGVVRLAISPWNAGGVVGIKIHNLFFLSPL
jgi:hypothetical protein